MRRRTASPTALRVTAGSHRATSGAPTWYRTAGAASKSAAHSAWRNPTPALLSVHQTGAGPGAAHAACVR
jgi:hypothetical protein